MIGRIYAIALNTFREAIRKRVLYGIIAAVVIFQFGALVLGAMSLRQEARIARDLGLGGVSFFGSVTAIVLGVLLLHTEVQRRTIHTIVSKPLRRFEFVLGKYLGMVATLTILVVLFTASMAIMLALNETSFSMSVAKALILAYVEVLLVAGIAVFFSSFATPFLAGIFSFAMFFFGRISDLVRDAIVESKETWIETTASVALHLVPDLHMLSISGKTVQENHVSVHGDFVTWNYIASSTLYATLYLIMLLALSVIIFQRRDFV